MHVFLANQFYPASVWYKHIYAELVPMINDVGEVHTITSRLLSHYLGYTTTHHILDSSLQATSLQLRGLKEAVKRVAEHEPLQYVLGEVIFLDETFKVNSDVLIPRSETEQMVADVIKQEHSFNDILDLCTGSGCIAISLKKAYPHAEVYALDVSESALDMADQNAKRLEVDIHWLQVELLHNQLPPKQWDLIISNPPYIPLADKKYLQDNIVNYEPHEALFVPSDNPLIFYKRIAELGKQHLIEEGWLYLEVHENLSEETANIFCDANYRKVKLHRDLNEKNRWLSCHK